MTWGITFRGHALSSANGVTVANISEKASTNIREQKLKEGGASLDLLSLTSRTVTLSGKVQGDTASNFKTNLRALQSKFSDPTAGDLILERTYKLSCVPIPGALTFGPNILSANWTCRFVSGDMFWSKTTATSGLSSAFGVSGTQDYDGTLAYDADYAKTYPSWTLTNNGEGSTITNLDLTITDTTNNQAFKVSNFDLGNNDALTIDPNIGQVYISTSASGASKPPQKVDGSLWSVSGASVGFTALVNTTSLTNGVILGFEYYSKHFSFGA